MLKYGLMLKEVVLPGPSGLWPTPLDLNLELNEVLLIEGVGPTESKQLLDVMATLQFPVAGQAWHWGQEGYNMPREELYALRRRIGYFSTDHSLLILLTVGENIVLGDCYHYGLSTAKALAEHAELLDLLELRPYLSRFPTEVEPEVAIRALWARELVKAPDLLLAVLDESATAVTGHQKLIAYLRDYLSTRASAVLLGRSLKPFYSLASRFLSLDAGRLLTHPLPEHQGLPLTSFLPLLVEE